MLVFNPADLAAPRQRPPLATLDKHLRKAAVMEGVPVLPMEPLTQEET